MKRKEFIQATAISSLALTIPMIRAFGRDFPGQYQLPKRVLGSTGEKVSAIAFGGIMLNDNPQDFANEIVAKAWEMGVNYYDIAPGYGNAQEKLGPALKPYREKAFLACKTGRRDAAGAKAELEDSLRKLETGYFELYQLHAINSVEDVEKAFGEKGAMKTFIRAKEEGQVKYLGFSAHSVAAALRAMELYPFDTAMFPINFAAWSAGDFGPQIFDLAEKKKMGIIALKAMALTLNQPRDTPYDKNVWYRPITNDKLMDMALRFSLSKNIATAIPPGKSTLFFKALEIMKTYKPVTPSEISQLEALAARTIPVFSNKST